MKVSIVGTGYVGLVSGACLAHLGHQVTCVDIDPAKVEMIARKDPPIYEKGLQELLDANVPERLTATTDLRAAVLDSDLSLIAVGTPFDGQIIDLKFIKQVAQEIGEALAEKDSWHMVVVKSTVVPGTTTDVVLPILEQASGKKAGIDFGVGMNPEFLREGEAIEDFMEPDRIVFGGIDERSIDALAELYEVFETADKVRTDPSTAEMIKYTANSLLATLISFSNEIANLCAVQRVDVAEAMQGVHLDRRFSPILETGERVRPGFVSYVWPGAGFGGSCFPKDVKALVAHGENSGIPMQLLRSVIEVNNRQPQKMIDMLEKELGNIAGSDITVLGVAFKPGTDDIRESPSLPVIEALAAKGAKVTAFDPIARHEAEHVLGDRVIFRDTLEDALNGAKAILLMTAWPEFRDLPEMLAKGESAPLLIDGRRMLNKNSVDRYAGIGL
ncbi:MAG: UDP-glucose/GDP-mannose dehydrogenase family protein [Hyphomonadaceae bacterium]|nr:UDP-glucose/GDP-mannose dehydrogenase family protein [Hyphomonadaceae bacterium]